MEGTAKEAEKQLAEESAKESIEEAAEGNYQPLENRMGKLFAKLLDVR